MAHVAVVGLGYAGLPMAVELGQAGFEVTGIDIDNERTRLVSAGVSPVSDVDDASLKELVDSNRLRATTSYDAILDADCVLICVPTPLTDDRKPNMRYIEAAVDSIGSGLHPGMLVVLQSTSALGTTRALVAEKLDAATDLQLGEDYFVAYAPERIDPGNTRFTVRNTPKIVSGVTPECQELACLLFTPIVDELTRVSSPEVAEMAKLVENTFRFINISFANELAMLCDRAGVNAWEVIDAAATKPFAFMAHYPGPGVGGHCIPIVPFFLEAAAQDHGMVGGLIQAAGQINDEMPRFVVNRLEAALAKGGKSLATANILLLGMSYKADIGDCRESPSLQVLEILGDRAGSTAYYDPMVSRVQNGASSCASLSWEEVQDGEFDAAVLLTAHRGVDYQQVGSQVDFILDTHHSLGCLPGVTIVGL